MSENSKFPQIIYTSQSLEEAEAQAGEKLYQIEKNVYVNQAQYDFIHSEEIPVIEDEALDSFIKIEIEASDSIAALWFETETKFLILSKTENPKEFRYSLLNFSGENYKRVKQGQISFHEEMGEFRSLAIDAAQNYLLLTFQKHLAIWDFENDKPVKSLYVEGNGLLKADFYPSDFQVWALVINEHEAACEWLRWDYFSDVHAIYDLENKGMYGWGASLHPSGLLIGALWNSYSAGYHIHTFVSAELKYYREPTAHRSDYESFSPCFSPDGKTFAFVANPYLAFRQNYSKICLYKLETGELIKEFYTGLSRLEKQAHFVQSGKRIAFFEKNSEKAHVFNPETGKRLAVLLAAKTIHYFSGHRLAGYYALAHEDGVTVYFTKTLSEGNPTEFQASAIEIAKKFMEANEAALAKPNFSERQALLKGKKLDIPEDSD